MAETAQIKFRLDDRELAVPPGTLVIEVARQQGIEIPSFCYYPGLALQAACRMCLVEVEKAPKLQTACTLVAVNGMVVRTNTPQVHEARKSMLEFLLANHPLDCPVCDKGGECELQDMTFRYGADRSRFAEEKLHVPEVRWSNVVYYDAPRCILCFRCVRVCDEGMDVKALGVGQRGAHSVIIPNRDGYLECVECGMCIDICPVGALTSGTYRYQTRPWEMQYVPTVCPHCSNGCKTTLSVRNHEILRANNRDLSGYNGDFLCAKGRFAFDFTRQPERLNQPLIRLGGRLEPTSWQEALQTVASRLATIRKQNGPDAIAFYGSNRTTNEENYLLGRIARASVGTNNVDHHRTADYAGLMALAATLAGSDSTSGGSTHSGSGRIFATMRDLESALALLLISNDATEQSPLVAWQIRTAIRHHRARLYILDSREQQLHRKAQDFVLFSRGQEAAAIARLSASGSGTVDASERDLDRRVRALRDALAGENDLIVLFGAAVQGAALARLGEFARERAALGKRTRFMALGDYANSRGAADMGLLPDLLPGYAPIANPAARQFFGELWGATLSEKAGLDSRVMLSAAAAGRLKALYVVGANPAKKTNFVGSKRMGMLDLLVVQDLYLSETARLADIVLPALSGFEKSGTMTNTAGEVQLVCKGGDFMGARSDFDILRIISFQLAQQGLGEPIRLRTPDAAFEEISRQVPGYGVSWTGLLSGAAEATRPNPASANGHGFAEAAEGVIFSSNDSLFTSGSLTPYCRMIRSLREAGATL
ncbi:MAG: NADH dehydrogenase (quinone) subunit G [Acidobacteria bacterium]|nr:MAG: NADH dehydrogenase (quinone) subunit G [Acidobacteriota bacterium]